MKARRARIECEAGKTSLDAFIPQEHAPGAEAEVDFGEVWVDLAEVRTKCYMFAFRPSYSAKPCTGPDQGQEAFLEGHLDAFATIGGISTRRPSPR